MCVCVCVCARVRARVCANALCGVTVDKTSARPQEKMVGYCNGGYPATEFGGDW